MAEGNSDQLLVATSSFITELDGKRITVKKGQTRVRAGHPLTKGREHLFKPADAQFDVETARQEPVAPRKGRGGATTPASTPEAPTEPASPPQGDGNANADKGDGKGKPANNDGE